MPRSSTRRRAAPFTTIAPASGILAGPRELAGEQRIEVVRGRLLARLAVAAGVGAEAVAETVGHRIAGPDRDRDRQPWPERCEPVLVEVLDVGGQHAAPARRRRLHADTKEVEAGEAEDRVTERGGRGDRQRRQHLAPDVAADDPESRGAEELRRLDVLFGGEAERLRPSDAEEARRQQHA